MRLALLMAALVVIVGFGLRADGRRRHPVMLAIWAAIPGAMLVATPGIAIDLARLGPVEPMLVAGMGCGLALALASTRRLLEPGRPRVLWLAAFVAGYALWLLGVYQKEASICALALFPFLYFVLDRRWRAAGVVAGPLYRSKGFLLAAGLLALPLLHMMYEITQVTADGETVYGTDVPHGIGGWVTRLWDSAEIAVRLSRSARHVRVAAAWPARCRSCCWRGRSGAVACRGCRSGCWRRDSAPISFRVWVWFRRPATSSRSWRSSPPRPSSCSPTDRDGFSSPES